MSIFRKYNFLKVGKKEGILNFVIKRTDNISETAELKTAKEQMEKVILSLNFGACVHALKRQHVLRSIKLNRVLTWLIPAATAATGF